MIRNVKEFEGIASNGKEWQRKARNGSIARNFPGETKNNDEEC